MSNPEGALRRPASSSVNDIQPPTALSDEPYPIVKLNTRQVNSSVASAGTTTSFASATTTVAPAAAANSIQPPGGFGQAALIAGALAGTIFLLGLFFLLIRYRTTIRQRFRPVVKRGHGEADPERSVAEGSGGGVGAGGIYLSSTNQSNRTFRTFSTMSWDHTRTFAPPSITSRPERPREAHCRSPLNQLDSDTEGCADADDPYMAEPAGLDPFTNYGHLSPPGQLHRNCSVKTVASWRPRLVTPSPPSPNPYSGGRASRRKTTTTDKNGQPMSSRNLTAAALAWWVASGTCKSPEHRRRYSQLGAEEAREEGEELGGGGGAPASSAAIGENNSRSDADADADADGTERRGSSSTHDGSRLWTAPSSRRPSPISSQRASLFSVATTSEEDGFASPLSGHFGRALSRSESAKSGASGASGASGPMPSPPIAMWEGAVGGIASRSRGSLQPQQETQRGQVVQRQTTGDSLLFTIPAEHGFDFGL